MSRVDELRAGLEFSARELKKLREDYAAVRKVWTDKIDASQDRFDAVLIQLDQERRGPPPLVAIAEGAKASDAFDNQCENKRKGS
jgi:alkanesulfonate monooxygenase SsuD/methylene tetrahydromethanopterin reductase-like flavin-dependent oxidoreductase (luciferase family)